MDKRELCGICVDDVESLGVGLENKIKLTATEDAYGPIYSMHIGRLKGDEKISYFKNDIANNNTDRLDKVIDNIDVINIDRTVLSKDDEMMAVTDIYLPYKIEGHSAFKPTEMENYVDGCCNVEYVVEYEVLLVAGDGLTRYVTDTYKTRSSGSISLYDQIASLEDVFEEYIDEGKQGFRRSEEGGNYFEAKFYNAAGDETWIEISCVSELLSMITMVRTIKCEHNIIVGQDSLED